jgi:hypothetical protein
MRLCRASRPAGGSAAAPKHSGSPMGSLWSVTRIWRCTSKPTRSLATSWGGRRMFCEIFNRKLAAEPHAIWERRLELEREAGQQARRSPVYTDFTVRCTRRVPCSMKNSTCSRRRKAVSWWKKSAARMVVAWQARNACQVCPVRVGAGPTGGDAEPVPQDQHVPSRRQRDLRHELGRRGAGKGAAAEPVRLGPPGPPLTASAS